jgi:glucosamine--fructose-6-phosphate aminotransferase (isomerizing)
MTTESDFDPTARLAGPPDPWDSAPMPTARGGVPYHMTEMIAAEPALARRMLERLADDSAVRTLADAIRATIAAHEPVIVTGCGTSEHGALAAAAILGDAAREAGLSTAVVISEQAFELSLAPPASGMVIGVSHDGGTAATNAALAASRRNGRPTAALTVSRRSPIGTEADIVVETAELDHGWCHTVGYLSPILAATAVGALITGKRIDVARVQRLLADGARDTVTVDAIAARFADASQLIVVASGADRPTGRELVLKVEEAAWLPSAYRDLETFLHGHLPATDQTTGIVLVLTDRTRRAERLARARQTLEAARFIGLRAAGIMASEVTAELDDSLTPAGRLIVGEGPELPNAVAALVGGVTPLQLLTERLARARGTDPDLIRREDPIYLAAAGAAEG